MKAIDLKELHKIHLDMLADIDKFCRHNDIRYSLGGGTLLGAVRHKGFIPWDDDVDIMMPRKDYDRFVSTYNDKISPYKCIDYVMDKDVRYAKAWAKIHDTRTICIETKELADLRHGVFIDVFPIDGLPENDRECRKFLKRCASYKHRLKMSMIRKRKYNTDINLPKFILSHIIPTKTWKGLMEKTSRKYPYETSKYAGATTGSYRMRERYRRELFESYMDIPFETCILRSITDYDTYLKQHYDNYMELPPEEMRVTHNIKAFWR